MAASLTLYAAFEEHLLKSTVQLLNDTLKASLHSSAYTPNVNGHAQWSDVSASQVAAAGGWPDGGMTITNPSVTRVGGTTTFDADDVVHTAASGNIPAFRYVIMRSTASRNGVTEPLIGFVLGDTTPADIPQTLDGATLRVRFNAAGIFQL